MKELNKKILDNAIRNLPDYEPKAGLWEQLQNEMQQPPVDPLQEAINQLPSYEPSTGLWDKIEQQLHPTPQVAFVSKRWLSIAASLMLLVSAFWFLNSNEVQDEAVITYSTEKVDNFLLIKDWDDDEDVFTMINEVCDLNKLACANPEIKVLKEELEELNSARLMLKTAIGEYGTNPDLVQELTDIEMERTSITKEILERIA